MGATTKIEWCDHTWNPWWGCAKVAAGCAHCYAETFAKRTGKAKWGAEGTRVKMSESYWRQPLKWNQAAEKSGVRARVFCASMADVFEDWKGEVRDSKGSILHRCRAGHLVGLDAVYVHGAECSAGCNRAAYPLFLEDLRADLLRLFDRTPWIDWLVLTKRPENILRMWRTTPGLSPQHPGSLEDAERCVYRHNVWLGTSIAEQQDADQNVPELLACRDLSPVLFLSCEPLVGPVNLKQIPIEDKSLSFGDRDYPSYTFWNALTGFRTHKAGGWTDKPPKKVDWVIVGGESGPKARPFETEWGYSIIDQCKAASVACFVKQMGADPWHDESVGGLFTVPEQVVSGMKINLVDRSIGGFNGGGPGGSSPMCLKDPKGGDWSEWPEDLRVRELPNNQD